MPDNKGLLKDKDCKKMRRNDSKPEHPSRLLMIWRDPVVATVIGGLILAVLIAAAVYVYPDFGAFWKDVVAAGKHIVDFVVAYTSVPNWLLWPMLVFCGLCIGLLLVEWLNSRHESEHSPDPFRDYRTDNFYKMRWRWDYSYREICNIGSFCPRCDFQIEPRSRYGYGLEFFCRPCNGVVATVAEQDSYDLQVMITRLIQQKIRANTWQKTLEVTQ